MARCCVKPRERQPPPQWAHGGRARLIYVSPRTERKSERKENMPGGKWPTGLGRTMLGNGIPSGARTCGKSGACIVEIGSSYCTLLLRTATVPLPSPAEHPVAYGTQMRLCDRPRGGRERASKPFCLTSFRWHKIKWRERKGGKRDSARHSGRVRRGRGAGIPPPIGGFPGTNSRRQSLIRLRTLPTFC